MKRQPVDPSVWTDGAEPRLVGGRHKADGRLVFPLPPDAGNYAPELLPRHGRLWSYTVQRFAPKSPPYMGPQPFEPFAVGYVELPGALIVETRLTDVEFEDLAVGMPVELAIVPLRTDADGTVVTTYAFRPSESARRV
jgi:uncharacterized OB-fold protein